MQICNGVCTFRPVREIRKKAEPQEREKNVKVPCMRSEMQRHTWNCSMQLWSISSWLWACELANNRLLINAVASYETIWRIIDTFFTPAYKNNPVCMYTRRALRDIFHIRAQFVPSALSLRKGSERPWNYKAAKLSAEYIISETLRNVVTFSLHMDKSRACELGTKCGNYICIHLI